MHLLNKPNENTNCSPTSITQECQMEILVRVTLHSVHTKYSPIVFLSHRKDENISYPYPPKLIVHIGRAANKHANEVRHCAFSSTSPRDGGRGRLPYSSHRLTARFHPDPLISLGLHRFTLHALQQLGLHFRARVRSTRKSGIPASFLPVA